MNGWGLTIVDSLDTMLLMGLDEEFDRAMDFVETLNFHEHHVCLSFLVFVSIKACSILNVILSLRGNILGSSKRLFATSEVS